jgi:hypothetical protein
VVAACAAAGLWAVLVARSPPAFFGIAAPFCALWIGLSLLASPAAAAPARDRLAVHVALGAAVGLVLYGLSRVFLWGACGGFTDALCVPLADMFVRFETRGVLAALALGLLVAPAEELFWRGVVQAHLTPRLGAPGAVLAATALAVLVALATGEPFLALATAPTYAAWGALAARTGSLVPAVVSHAVWSVLVASVAPPL